MNEITEKMLKEISNWNGSFKGAYNIRENGCSVGRQSSENIKIDSKTDEPGLDIHILPGTKGETVSIPACVTHGDVDDLVYNDFYVGEGADVVIVAGCGVHTETGEPARHNGIHRFFLAPNSHVKYVEKHIGTGKGFGIRTIDPVTEVFLEENAVLEMDTAQIGGVDRTTRKTKATVAAGGKLLIRERILTEKEQTADTEFEVELNGEILASYRMDTYRSLVFEDVTPYAREIEDGLEDAVRSQQVQKRQLVNQSGTLQSAYLQLTDVRRKGRNLRRYLLFKRGKGTVATLIYIEGRLSEKELMDMLYKR